jgi:tetratricopeptide (TPR) repeat protein
MAACASSQKRAAALAEEAYQVRWGDWEKVISLSSRAIEIAPNYSFAYYVRGAAYNATNRYAEAVRDLDEAVRLNDQFEEARVEMAMAHFRLGEFEEARIDIEAAISVNPYSVPSLMAMVQYHSLKNSPGAACEALRRAVRKGFNDPEYLFSNPDFRSLVEAPCFESFMAPPAP